MSRAQGDVGTSSRDRPLERVAADLKRIDRAEIVKERRLRAALGQLDLREPLAVAPGPVVAGAVVADVVAQQELPEPVPGAHQITADVLARANHVAQRLLLAARNTDWVQSRRSSKGARVARRRAVGLDLVLRGTLDLSRRRDHAVDPGRRERAGEPEPGRARLVRDARRAGQRGAEPHHLARVP